jgi:hypothetical protein
MTDNIRNIIQSFFGSLGSDAFMGEYWPRIAYHEHGEVHRMPPVFQAPLLTDLETLSRIYRGPGFYFAGEGSMLRPLDRPALELYRTGHTVYFGDVAPFIRGSRIFLGALEAELGVNPGCARMAVFASPQNDGAAVHYDTNDVFSVQLAGQKQFNIAPVKELVNPTGMQYSTNTTPRPYHYPQMAAGFPDPADAEFAGIDMTPGSVLFMPRGTWHYTEASQDSVAVSIIIDPTPAVDAILGQFRFILLQDPRWRAPLYGAWDQSNPESDNDLKELLAELRRAADKLTPEQIMYGNSNLGYRLDRIDENTRFQVIPTARMKRFAIGPYSSLIKVTNDDLDRGSRETLSTTVSETVADTIEWLAAQRGPVSAREIAAHADITFPEAIELLKELGNGEFLMPLWFDPMSGDRHR